MERREWLFKAKGHEVNAVCVSVYYSLGGMNFFTYGTEPRGYYLSATPQERSDVKGVHYVSTTFGSGVKVLLKEVTRASKKAEAEAVEIAKTKAAELVDYVCKKNNVELFDEVKLVDAEYIIQPK